MAKHQTSYVIDLKGDLDARARRMSRSMKRFSRTGKRDVSRLSRAFGSLGRGLDKLGNKYTALLTGGTAVATTKYLTDLETKFTRLGVTSGKSAEQMQELKNRIFEVAQMPDIRVNPKELVAGVDAFVEKVGQLPFAMENLRNMGLAIQATGASGADIGKVLAEMKKMGIDSSQDILKAIDILNVQSKSGAFTLKYLAQLGPKVITAYTAQVKGGRDPVKVIREMGAALQVIRRGSQNAAEAATAFNAVLRDVTDPKKIKMLNSIGVNVFDPEQLKEGKEVLRPINELMVDIMKATGGKQTILGQIFSDEARRAFNQVSADEMKKFYNVQATGQRTIEDSARIAGTLASAMTELQTALKSFADANLTEYIKGLADAINSLDAETLNRILKGLAAFAVGMGGLVVGRKLYNGGRAAVRLFGGARRLATGGRGGAGGSVMLGGVQRVYVVNMPAGFGSRAGGRNGLSTGQKVARTAAGVTLAYTGANVIDESLNNTEWYRNLSQKVDEATYSGIHRALSWAGLGDKTTDVFNWLTIGANGEDVAKRLQQSADKIDRAADKMANAETTVNVDVDQSGRLRVGPPRTANHAADPYYRDPYAGPMNAGAY